MKPYYGQLHDIRCLVTPRNHLCVYGLSDQYSLYAGKDVCTSKIRHIDFYSDGYAELETMDSRYGVIGNDLIILQNCVTSHSYADLTLAHIKND